MLNTVMKLYLAWLKRKFAADKRFSPLSPYTLVGIPPTHTQASKEPRAETRSLGVARYEHRYYFPPGVISRQRFAYVFDWMGELRPRFCSLQGFSVQSERSARGGVVLDGTLVRGIVSPGVNADALKRSWSCEVL